MPLYKGAEPIIFGGPHKHLPHVLNKEKKQDYKKHLSVLGFTFASMRACTEVKGLNLVYYKFYFFTLLQKSLDD